MIDLTVDFTDLDEAAAYLTVLQELPFAASAEMNSLAQDSESGKGAANTTRLYAAVYHISMASEQASAAAAASIGEQIAPGAAASDLTTQEESVNDGTTP